MSLFPDSTPATILSCQFSSWYPQFKQQTIRSTIIRPLSAEFVDYLRADGVFVPQGSEDIPYESTLSDDEDQRAHSESDDESEDDDRQRHFAFPELDERIRACIAEYDAVFPKMNFSSPKDASWVLPASSPLKCTCPADVYLLLKSSDFISHDLSKEDVFDGSSSSPASVPYELELVLRKWYPVDRGRELRCFVRDNTLFAISQRDTNFYDFLNESGNQTKILETVSAFFADHIQPKMSETADYIFDFLLTRDYSSGHIIDFNAYLPKTDPLLFSYEELLEIFQTRSQEPKLLVIDSAAHPAANTSGPANQHNMMPFDALNLSTGKNIADFAELWKKEVQEASRSENGQ